ncbi:MAG TPA: hypothetical protein VN316_02545 [candidate division Zixibacteria bacterium]|nr:hypothetical protein [candidate division Zixibacteria bacterium]
MGVKKLPVILRAFKKGVILITLGGGRRTYRKEARFKEHEQAPPHRRYI